MGKSLHWKQKAVRILWLMPLWIIWCSNPTSTFPVLLYWAKVEKFNFMARQHIFLYIFWCSLNSTNLNHHSYIKLIKSLWVQKSIDGEWDTIFSLFPRKRIFPSFLYGKISAQLYFKANMLWQEPIMCLMGNKRFAISLFSVFSFVCSTHKIIHPIAPTSNHLCSWIFQTSRFYNFGILYFLTYMLYYHIESKGEQ